MSDRAVIRMLRLLKRALRSPLFFLPGPVADAVVFEVRALIGNLLAAPLELGAGTKHYINLGSGPLKKDGYLNIDFFGVPEVDYGADLRRPLKIAEGAVDGIVTEHVLEHLTYGEAKQLLGECYRILKPGGILRVIVPDLSLFVLRYGERDDAWFKRWETLMFTQSADPERSIRRLASPLQAISFVTQEYGHRSAWDFETLKLYLTESGFRQIDQVGFKQGRCTELFLDKDLEERKFVSLYAEAVK